MEFSLWFWGSFFLDGRPFGPKARFKTSLFSRRLQKAEKPEADK
jgi:hypothetical protein